MAWIQVVGAKEATGGLAETYEAASPWSGEEIFKIHSLNPRSLGAHVQLYRTLMYGRSGLSRTQREMLAVVVSAMNRCEY